MENETGTHIVKLLDKKQLTSDAYSFYFERPEGFSFKPGQYMRVTLTILHPDERGNKRYFSISSSPTNKDHLMITTRIIKSAFKNTLLTMSPGNTIEIFGPMGNFVLNEEEKRHRVFIAGGIGITPFHSMIQYAADKNIAAPITHFSSFSTPDEIIFHDDLMNASQKNPNIRVIETVTHPEESKTLWSGITGRISHEMVRQYVPEYMAAVFYICGPAAMTETLQKSVKDMGVPDGQIKVERFSGY